jgi:hypothetical protein
LFALCSNIFMESSESRTAPPPEAASDDFASPSPLQPPGPSDRLAFEPVPLRYREDGLTPARQRAYVEALADCGIACQAAARVGLTEQAIARVRRRSDARSFDEACEAARLFGARRIRSVAWERAIEGTVRGRYYRGELVAEERVFDNRLLIYLYGKTEALLARDDKAGRAICDDWEAHMDALEQGLEAPPAPKPVRPEFTGHEVREDDDGVWWTSFPPPARFDGEEQGEFGEYSYKRTLSAKEQAVVEAEYDRDDAEYRAAEAARRDRFFGFAGDEVSPEEAETCETSGPPDPYPGPIEYKSLIPPSPAPTPSLRRKPEPGNALVRSSRHRHSRMPEPRHDEDDPLPLGRESPAPHPNARSPASLSMNREESRSEIRTAPPGTAAPFRGGQGPSRPPVPRQARPVGRRAPP